MKKLFYAATLTLLFATATPLYASIPGTNEVQEVLRDKSGFTDPGTYYIGKQKVKFIMHSVKTRRIPGVDPSELSCEPSSWDGYFYYRQGGKRIKYTVKQDSFMIGITCYIKGYIYLNGKKVGEYCEVIRAPDSPALCSWLILHGKKYKQPTHEYN